VRPTPQQLDEPSPLFCDRCTVELTPGAGNFYRVTIEAVGDPTPPSITDEDLQANVAEQINKLIDQLQKVSPQEAMDQVYRRVTLCLCTPCYREWIENPTG